MCVRVVCFDGWVACVCVTLCVVRCTEALRFWLLRRMFLQARARFPLFVEQQTQCWVAGWLVGREGWAGQLVGYMLQGMHGGFSVC